MLAVVLLMSISCRVMPDDYDWPVVPDHAEHAQSGAVVGSLSEDSARPIQDTSDAPVPLPQVVVLVTDGARIDETFGDGMSTVTDEPTTSFLPRMRAELLPLGTLVRTAFNTGVTITAEGHASIVTGARIPLGNLPSDDGAGAFRPDIPTLFELIRQQDGASGAAVTVGGNTVHLQGLTHSLHPAWGSRVAAQYTFVSDEEDSTQPAGDDLSVIEAVKHRIMANKSRLIVANLHQMDRSGHYHAQATAYAEKVKEVDGPIAELWHWIQSDPRYRETTTLIIVADHGRHRWGTDDDHRHHGDVCAGCRQIPMLFLGPRVRQGHTSHMPATLEDVGTTIGALLDLHHPHAEGRVLTEILDESFEHTSPAGRGQLAASGSHRATRLYLDDPTHRSVVQIDGESVSRGSAFHAEAPAIAAGEDTQAACWRELHIDITAPDDSLETWPWEAKCMVKLNSEGWAPLTFPNDQVSPYFHPAMSVSQDGALWVAYADNPTGNWEAVDQGVRLARWTTEGGWAHAGTGATQVRYPLHPAMLPVDGGAVVAFVSSDTITDAASGISPGLVHGRARYRRHIVVERVDWDGEAAPVWNRVFRGYTEDHYTADAVLPAPSGAWPGWAEVARADRPQLNMSGRRLQMSFLTFDATHAGAHLWMVQSDDDGRTWGNPTAIDSGGQVIPTVTPQWIGPQLIWARMSEVGIAVCRTVIGAATECADTEAHAIDSIVPNDGGATVSVLIDKEWQVRELTW